MAAGKHTTAQRDFSAGEVDVTLKRSEDSPHFKAGLRQCANFRLTDAGKPTNRLGRSIKFIDGTRVDEILMSPGNVFYLIFGSGYLSVRNAAGAQVFTSTKKGDGSTAIPWTGATARFVSWDAIGLAIYIAYADGFPANVPQVLTWDGVSQTSTWTLSTFAEIIGGSGTGASGGGGTLGGGGNVHTPQTGGSAVEQSGGGAYGGGSTKRTLFYRISPLGITMSPSDRTGSVTLTFSAGMKLTAAHVGTRMRFVGRQVLITAVASAISATATVEEPLLGSQFMAMVSDPSVQFSIGDAVIGSVTGNEGIVTAFNDPTHMTVQLTKISGDGFSTVVGATDTIVGPGGSLNPTSINAPSTPSAVAIWDDEVMNSQLRGWPSFVFTDQGRLGFANFPSVPAGIAWSAYATPADFYIPVLGVVPTSAICEVAPGKSQVFYVVPGAQSSEFVFCDNGVYAIPINAANPLSATTGVAFDKISDDGCAAVQPRRMQSIIVYVNAGGKSVRAIMTTGAYNRTNESRDITEFHNHLLNVPVAIACPSATDANFPERYFYVLNGDGTLAVGKVAVSDGNVAPGTLPGWVSESSVGNVQWVSSRLGGGSVNFTTTYQTGSAPAVTVMEKRDFTQYLDAGLSYNAVPTALTPPGGKGPLWWMSGGTCTVMDLGTRQLGLYQIDANGFLIAQNFGGENLASSQLVVGQAWTATLEPFAAGAPPGQDMDQRMDTRGIARVAAYFENSTGFLWAKLFSGLLTRTSPPYGAIMNTRRVTTYNQDDDATQPPFLREGTDTFRPGGQDYDPRVAIIKDTSGPLTILEIGMEISV